MLSDVAIPEVRKKKQKKTRENVSVAVVAPSQLSAAEASEGLSSQRATCGERASSTSTTATDGVALFTTSSGGNRGTTFWTREARSWGRILGTVVARTPKPPTVETASLNVT